MKKWILYPLAGLLGLFALAYVVGLLTNPEIKTSVAIEIARPPEKVYALMADPNEIPKYWPEVGKIEIIQQTPMRYRMVSPQGSGTMEVVFADPPRRIVSGMIRPEPLHLLLVPLWPDQPLRGRTKLGSTRAHRAWDEV